MPRALPRSFARALCAATLCSLAPVAIAAGLPADLGERLARDYARPAMARMAQASEQMDAALGAWCARPDAAGATRVNDAHTGLALAWSGIEFLRLVRWSRPTAMSGWPSGRYARRHARQVQAAIAAQDPELIKPARWPGAAWAACRRWNTCCTASRRLRADGADFAYACGYARAVSANVSGISRELAQAWSAEGDFGRQFAAPRPANDLYRNSQEVAAEAVKALSTGLQFARDVKILPVLGDAPEAARPKRAAYWRSNLSSARWRPAWTPCWPSTAQAPIRCRRAGAGSTRPCVAMSRAAQTLRDAAPYQDVASDGETRRQWTLAGLTLKNAKAVVDQDLAPALGVTIGFNALDGD